MRTLALTYWARRVRGCGRLHSALGTSATGVGPRLQTVRWCGDWDGVSWGEARAQTSRYGALHTEWE